MTEVSQEVEDFRLCQSWGEWGDYSLEEIAARLMNELHEEQRKNNLRYKAQKEAEQQRDAAIEQLEFLKNSAGIRAIWNNRVRIDYRKFFKTLSLRQRHVVKRML